MGSANSGKIRCTRSKSHLSSFLRSPFSWWEPVILATAAKCELIWVLHSSSPTFLALAFEVEKPFSSMDVATPRQATGGEKSPLQDWEEMNETVIVKNAQAGKGWISQGAWGHPCVVWVPLQVRLGCHGCLPPLPHPRAPRLALCQILPQRCDHAVSHTSALLLKGFSPRQAQGRHQRARDTGWPNLLQWFLEEQNCAYFLC